MGDNSPTKHGRCRDKETWALLQESSFSRERSIRVRHKYNKCHKGTMMEVQVGALWAQRGDVAVTAPQESSDISSKPSQFGTA